MDSSKRSALDKALYEYLPLISRIDALALKKKSITVAIDGNSAAGKSSLAALLQSVYACNVFSTDDFFLQPFQRTRQRLGEAGGNVDYERFFKEVLEPLQHGAPFSYRVYDCQRQILSEEQRSVMPNPLHVVEGVYSLHPYFHFTYDIKVFLRIDEEEQRRRLAERSMELYDRFLHEWIPMEKQYFDVFQIAEQCDFVFDTHLREG